MLDVFAVLTFAQLGIAVQALLEADAVVLFAPISLAVAALANQEAFLNFHELSCSSLFGLVRIEVFAVAAGAQRGVALSSALQANAILLRAPAILARARLHLVSNRRTRSNYVSAFAFLSAFNLPFLHTVKVFLGLLRLSLLL